MEVLTHTQGSETRLLGLDGAAIYLNITPRSIYRLIDRGIIRPVRIAVTAALQREGLRDA